MRERERERETETEREERKVLTRLCCHYSTDDGPSVSLTISVMDVRDEVPVITGTKIRRIVEELPIGTRLGGLFKMTDADVEDQHVFTLTGAF